MPRRLLALSAIALTGALACLARLAAAGDAPDPPKDPVPPEPPKAGVVIFEPFDEPSRPLPFHDVKIEKDLAYAESEGSCKAEKYRGDTPFQVYLLPSKVGLPKDKKPGPLFRTADMAFLACRVYLDKADAVTVKLRTDEEKPVEYQGKVADLKQGTWNLVFVSSSDLKAADKALPGSAPIASIQVLAHMVKGAEAKDVRLGLDNLAAINAAARDEAEKLFAEAERKAADATKARKAEEHLKNDVTTAADKDGFLLSVDIVKHLRARAVKGIGQRTILRVGSKIVGSPQFIVPLTKRKEGLPEADGYKVLDVPGVTGCRAADLRKSLVPCLEAKKPESAAILFDLDELAGRHPYELYADLSFAIDACLRAGCTPILVTPPIPRPPKGSDAFYLHESLDTILKELAGRMRVPLLDSFGLLNLDDAAAVRNFSGGKVKDESFRETNEPFLKLYVKLENHLFERARKAPEKPPVEADDPNKGPKPKPVIKDDKDE